MKKKRLILSVTNDVFTDQRVNRMAHTLHQMGFGVEIIGVRRPGSPPFKPWYATIRRIGVLFQRKVFFYAEFNIRLFFKVLFSRFDLLVANDLDTLPAMHLVSRIRRKPLVYDTHEYFTGSPEVAGRPVIFFFWKWLEDRLFPRQQTIITVNASIARLYHEKYRKELHVVRNLPHYLEPVPPPSRQELGLPQGPRIILLQGSGINVDRGGEELIQAMDPSLGIQDAILLIIGSGNVIHRLKQQVRDSGLQQRVMFLPRMPFAELWQYTRHASVGVSLDKDSSLNYRFSLPNKLFDYIMAGVPVLASDLPEVAAVIRQYNCGHIINSHEPAIIAHTISQMLADTSQLQQWKQNCLEAAKELCWEKEEGKLREIYGKYVEKKN